MTYEDFFSPEDVETYKRVKRGTMILADLARETVAEMVGGSLERDENKKAYLRTPKGLWRLAMATNSDNNLELREHQRLGGRVVIMGDPYQMHAFFRLHELREDDSWDSFVRILRVKMSDYA